MSALINNPVDNQAPGVFIKILHYYSGLTLSVFVAFHILNHLVALVGLQEHIDFMRWLRIAYRNPFIECMLLLAVLFQICSGVWLYTKLRKKPGDIFARLQIYSGLYLAFFFVVHVSAVMYGRAVQHVDTNVYYGIAGLNTFPYQFFFVPYYALAIMSFFTHIAGAHAKKMNKNLLGLPPRKQSVVIITTGVVCTIIILYGLTNGFKGYNLPKAYQLREQRIILHIGK